MIWFLYFLLLVASYYDLKWHRIPNSIVYLLFSIALFKFDAFYVTVLVTALIFHLLFGRWIGAGDIKLVSAIAIWSHILALSLNWIYLSLLLGGIFGLIHRRDSLPFAPFIAIAFIALNLAPEFGLI